MQEPIQILVLIHGTQEAADELQKLMYVRFPTSVDYRLAQNATLSFRYLPRGPVGHVILLVDGITKEDAYAAYGKYLTLITLIAKIDNSFERILAELNTLRQGTISIDTLIEEFSSFSSLLEESLSEGKSSSQTDPNATEESYSIDDNTSKPTTQRHSAPSTIKHGKSGVIRKLVYDDELLGDQTLDSGDEAVSDSEKSHQQENSLNAELPPKEKSDEEKIDAQEDDDVVVLQPPAQQPIMVFKWPEEKTPVFSLTQNILLFEAQDIENIPTALQMITRAAHISPRINEATHIHIPIKNQVGYLELTFDKKRGISPDIKWIKLSAENIHQTTQVSVEKSLRKVNKNASVQIQPQQDLSFIEPVGTAPPALPPEGDGQSLVPVRTTRATPPATPTKGNGQSHTPASPPSGQYLSVGCTPQKPNVEHVPKKNKIILPMLSDYTLETLTIDKIKELEKPYREIKCQRFHHTHPERDNDFNAILERKKTSKFVPTQLPIDLDIFLKKNKPWFLGVRRFFGRPIAKRYDEVKAYIAEHRHQRRIKYEQKNDIKFKPLDKPLLGTLQDFTTQIKEELSYGERRKYRSLVRESFQGLFLSREKVDQSDPDVQKLARHYAADHNYAVKRIKASRSSSR